MNDRQYQESHRQRDVNKQPTVQPSVEAILQCQLSALLTHGLQLADRIMELQREKRPQMVEGRCGLLLGGQTMSLFRSRFEERADFIQIASLGPGDVFGEIALISNLPRTATVLAKTPLDVVTVSRGAFEKLLAHLPGVEETMEGIMRQHLGRPLALNEPTHDSSDRGPVS